MYQDAFAVANEFLLLGERDQIKITPIKLLKLVYIAHGWHLAFLGEPLLRDQVEAWKYGPVVRRLYHTFKMFGNQPIERDEIPVELPRLNMSEPLAEFSMMIINRVWETYKRYTGPQLSQLTHQEDTPWYSVWNREGRYRLGTDIPDREIEEYYTEKLGVGRE